MPGHCKKSKLAVVLENCGVGNAAAGLEICPMYHRKSYTCTVRNKQSLIEASMQGLEGSNMPGVVIDP